MVRLKTRYLIAEVSAPRKLSLQREDIAGLIRESIARSYGDYGVGMLQYAFQGTVAAAGSSGRVMRSLITCTSGAVLYYNPITRLVAIRCARDQAKVVETSLVFVTEFQAQEVRFRIARVCGESLAKAGFHVPVSLTLFCLVVRSDRPGCSRTCREHMLKFSIERSEQLKLLSGDADWSDKIRAEIALIDPQ
jgi:RNase P/RNase MRP subunit POP5